MGFLQLSQNLLKNLKSLYGFIGHCLKIRSRNTWQGMDFEPHFRVYNSLHSL